MLSLWLPSFHPSVWCGVCTLPTLSSYHRVFTLSSPCSRFFPGLQIFPGSARSARFPCVYDRNTPSTPEEAQHEESPAAAFPLLPVSTYNNRLECGGICGACRDLRRILSGVRMALRSCLRPVPGALASCAFSNRKKRPAARLRIVRAACMKSEAESATARPLLRGKGVPQRSPGGGFCLGLRGSAKPVYKYIPAPAHHRSRGKLKKTSILLAIANIIYYL